MNNEELRRMIDGITIELDPKAKADSVDVKAKSNRVADMIARSLSNEFNNACRAGNWLDYCFDVCKYVNKQYCALMAISNERWRDYIEFVEMGAELSATAFITANYEYLEADEKHRIIHMTGITSTFRDFVYTFFTLQHIMMKTCGVNLDIE